MNRWGLPLEEIVTEFYDPFLSENWPWRSREPTPWWFNVGFPLIQPRTQSLLVNWLFSLLSLPCSFFTLFCSVLCPRKLMLVNSFLQAPLPFGSWWVLPMGSSSMRSRGSETERWGVSSPLPLCFRASSAEGLPVQKCRPGPAVPPWPRLSPSQITWFPPFVPLALEVKIISYGWLLRCLTILIWPMWTWTLSIALQVIPALK